MEKAKYELVTNVTHYFFTTTTRNTEECINIMKDKFATVITSYKRYRIFKTVSGIRELIWHDTI